MLAFIFACIVLQALNPSNDEVCLINESTAAAITAYQFLKDIRKPSSSSSAAGKAKLYILIPFLGIKCEILQLLLRIYKN